MQEWYPSACAPLNAPIEIISAQFLTRDQRPVRIPAGGAVNNGWGAAGPVAIVEPLLKSLPERLELSWFSYAENTFYQGDFALDAERLDALMEAGYLSPVTGKQATFDRILVGMAPGGAVALWLQGEQTSREAGFFLASERDMGWSSFSPLSANRGEQVQAMLETLLDKEALAAALLSARAGDGRWQDAYRAHWSWSPKLISRGRLGSLQIRYFNGERRQLAPERLPAEHPLPAQLDLYWANPDGLSYGATIRFDFSEISGAFTQLAPGGPVQLNLEVDTLAASVGVFLQTATEAYTFRRVSVRVFRL